MIEQTAYHEAGHAVTKVLEERHIGPIREITVLPSGDALGSVRSEKIASDTLTPRQLRAGCRVAVAGAVAEWLAGFPWQSPGGSDMRALVRGGLLMGCKAEFVRQCLAGAELMLRLNWGAVLQVAEWVRAAGTLQAPYAESLVNLALDRPARPLLPDSETLLSLLRDLEGVPEFVAQFEDVARSLNVRAA